MRGKLAFFGLVVALLAALYGVLGRVEAQPSLAGANMVLPFARRSRITQAFGGGHNGTDYRAANGTAVVAAKYGRVTVANDPWPDGTCMVPPPFDPGNHIHIDHLTGGYVTKYFHLQHLSFAVGVGNYVSPGQRIANADTTGTTGPDPQNPCNPPAAHLHFQLEVNGTAVDPYAGGTHWAGGEPFPMGYRDQNHAIQGPFLLDDPTIRNRWIAEARKLGSPIEDDWSGPCSAGAALPTCRYQWFERGYIYYEEPNGSAQVGYYSYKTFLPRVIASQDANAWNSTIYVRNLASNPTIASITFFTSGGRVLDSRVYDGLPGNATWEVKVRDVAFDPLLGSSFDGAALVAANQDVAVMVRTEKSDEVMSYTGVSSANTNTGWGQPGTVIYVPTVFWNPWGSLWKATIYLQNTSSTDTATFSITYYDSDGNPLTYCSPSNQSLPADGRGEYRPEACGGGYFGAAYIQSDQSLAVIVTQEESTNAKASQYNAFSSGAFKVYLISVMRTWYEWTSSFTVQNIGASNTSVLVQYYGDDGRNYSCLLQNLKPHASCIVVQSQSAPPGNACTVASGSCAVGDFWQGSAILTAGQPIVAIVNQEQENLAENEHSHQSYSGFIGGGTLLYAPFVTRFWTSGNDTYRSCSHVQDVGAAGTWIKTKNGYFYANGGMISDSGSEVWTDANKVAMFYVPVEPNVPDGFVGSVKVIRTASSIAGIHNYARARNGQEKDDYGASYNLPQR